MERSEFHPESPCLRCTPSYNVCTKWKTCERYKSWFRMKWRDIRRMFGVKNKK